MLDSSRRSRRIPVRRAFAFAPGIFLCASFVFAQQPAPATTPPAATPPSAKTAYYAGPDVTAPGPLPIALTDAATGGCKEVDGSVVFWAIVDAEGEPQDVYFTKALGGDLDKIALNVMLALRFKPGLRDGAPAAVVITDELRLSGCIQQGEDQAGRKAAYLRLQSVAGQKIEAQRPPIKGAALTFSESTPQSAEAPALSHDHIGRDVTAPVLIKSAEVQLSDYALETGSRGLASSPLSSMRMECRRICKWRKAWSLASTEMQLMRSVIIVSGRP